MSVGILGGVWGKSALAREGESSGSGVAAARATFSATGRVAPTTTRPKAPPAQHWVTHHLRLDGYMFFVCLFYLLQMHRLLVYIFAIFPQQIKSVSTNSGSNITFLYDASLGPFFGMSF